MSTPFSFSSKDRLDFFAKSDVEFDILIIGGGITGAGIALDASARGLSVALVEKHDFAWGTSSRSTKLIHGGLRYLKQLELGLVKEVGRERSIVHCNARNLVVPEKMLLPIIKKGSLGVYSTSAALWVYDFLAGVKNKERRKMLNKENTKKSEPLLNSAKLLGGGLYYEYRTDDARLTIEIIKKSVELGAYCLNYSEFTKPIYENALLSGAEVKDLLTEKTYEIRAKCVVNATGPWVDLLRKKDNSLNGNRLQLTKGVHLVVPYERFPLKQAVYFDVKDGRMVFAIPRQRKTYIGTTDTVYNEDINEPVATSKDAKYILNAVNSMFPKLELQVHQIESSWAGLRPLIHKDGKSPSELSRKDEIFVSESGLISIAGGKLTGYRKMAEKIVDRVVRKTGVKVAACTTSQIPVFGANFQHSDEISELIIQLTNKNKESGLNVFHIKEWVHRYGTETIKIINYYSSINTHNSDCEACALLAELSYGVDREMVMSLEDFYIRRSAKLYFDLPNVLNYLDEAGKLLCEKLGYSEEEVELQKLELKRQIALITAFKR